jgi:hypothetical protein
MAKAKKQDAPNQINRFIEAARLLGCDEDEKAFGEKLKKIAKAKPKQQPNK